MESMFMALQVKMYTSPEFSLNARQDKENTGMQLYDCRSGVNFILTEEE
jgi:hypothetical protein